MTDKKLLLDYVYDHEAALGEAIILTQPQGGGLVVDYTWAQTVDQARRMAAHLKAQGFEPGARIAMLSKNCAHFIMAELAIWMAGGTTVAIFPTETAHTVGYVLEHSGASLLFVGKLDNWEAQQSAVPQGLPCISFPLAPKSDYPKWDAIVERTAPLQGRIARAPDDLCLIAYTSGSTGEPKGVMHSFARATDACVAITAMMHNSIDPQVELRVLSYLPLAHILERGWVEGVSLIHGRGRLFFAESLDTFLQDLRRARPTVFLSVPRLWLKFQQGVFAKIPAKKLDLLLRIPIVSGLVARKVLAGLGLDQTLVATSGSAPIPAELISWYRRLGLTVLEGYGMTEDYACSHASSLALNAPGYVGAPIPGVQVRISDEGEILVRSPGQMVGYYKRPDLNAEVFTSDGFFHTGDRGERLPSGMLKITGRVKELFKTSKGKYVAPAPIENLLNADPLIEQSMVTGVGQAQPCALVVLSENIRPQLADAAVRARVASDLLTLLTAVNARLADYEQLYRIVVAKEPWTIENGMLTPTMKVKRSRIEAVAKDHIDGWYAGKEKVCWAQ
jgi:long-subunit acyl-CoA synthetase (AMP-forming)